MNKKTIPWIIISLLIVLILAACASGATQVAEEASPEPPVGEEPPAPEETVTLNLWVFEGEEEFLPTIKEAFEAQNPGIELNITEIPEDNYSVKVDTALAAADPPDIGFMFEPSWLKSGQFLGLDDMFAAEGINLEDYNQGALSGCFHEGKVYCIGTYSGGVMLFYNKDMFDAAGLPYPSADEPLTVDEFADLAAQLSNDAENLEDKVWGGAAEVMFWWSDPGYLFTEDGSTATFDDQATMHAHQVLADVVLNGDGPSGSDYELLGFEDLMSEGFIAMSVLDNIWGVEVLEEGGINYGVAPVPLEQAGDSPWVSSWTDSFGVFADSDHPEEALKFMHFMATEGNRLRLETGWLPLNLKLAEAEGYAEESEAHQQILKVMSFGRDSVFVPYFWDVTADVWDAWDTILEGDSAADVFPEFNEYMQETLDEAWETWDSIE